MINESISLQTIEIIGALGAVIWTLARIWTFIAKLFSSVATKKDLEKINTQHFNLDKKVDRIETELKDKISTKTQYMKDNQDIVNKNLENKIDQISRISKNKT